jgi:N-carbamoylputrescine amidase
MRITVCELPHAPEALERAWEALCEHTTRHRSELVLLPEFAMVEPVWESPAFDLERWRAVEVLTHEWLRRLPQLGVDHVVGARPATIDGRPYDQGFIWSRAGGLAPLRSKFFMPDEPGGWEARWFTRGDHDFAPFRAGDLSFGLNICSELWALETYGNYARAGVHAVLSPRATAAATTAKWISIGVVAAVRSGAFCLSSNRVAPSGTYGGVGWIISPDGELLARTSSDAPFATVEIDLDLAAAARRSYPRYVFEPSSSTGP